MYIVCLIIWCNQIVLNQYNDATYAVLLVMCAELNWRLRGHQIKI
jgi:hypothetical protein